MKKTIIALAMFGTVAGFSSCKNCVECEDVYSSGSSTNTVCNTDDVQGTQSDMNKNADPGEYWVCHEKE